MKKLLLSSMVAISLVSSASAAVEVKKAAEPKKEKAKTTLGLYVTAKDAGEYLQKDKNALLVDVRSPSEIMFIGAANRMDIHVPLLLLNDNKYMTKKSHYAMKKNKYALAEIKYELNKKNAKKDTAIFITCRSGSTRSAPVVNMLAKEGYTNVWTVVDGFEGGKVKEGKFKGERVKNGWLHSGLQWTWKTSEDKLWFACKYKDLFSKEDQAKCK